MVETRQGLAAKFCPKEEHLVRLEKLEKASERSLGGGLYLIRNAKGTWSISPKVGVTVTKPAMV